MSKVKRSNQIQRRVIERVRKIENRSGKRTKIVSVNKGVRVMEVRKPLECITRIQNIVSKYHKTEEEEKQEENNLREFLKSQGYTRF